MENKENIPSWPDHEERSMIAEQLEEGEIAEREIINENVEIQKSPMNGKEVEKVIRDLQGRVEFLEMTFAAANARQEGWGKARIITSAEMETMIKSAVCLGPDYGVGRAFIRTHLHREMGVPDSQHYSKRMNQTLRNLVASKELILDEQFQLYRNV